MKTGVADVEDAEGEEEEEARGVAGTSNLLGRRRELVGSVTVIVGGRCNREGRISNEGIAVRGGGGCLGGEEDVVTVVEEPNLS